MIEQEWFYLATHPRTEEPFVACQLLLWDGEEWHLPGYQPRLPHAIPGFDWFSTHDEAATALARTGGVYRES